MFDYSATMSLTTNVIRRLVAGVVLASTLAACGAPTAPSPTLVFPSTTVAISGATSTSVTSVTTATSTSSATTSTSAVTAESVVGAPTTTAGPVATTVKPKPKPTATTTTVASAPAPTTAAPTTVAASTTTVAATTTTTPAPVTIVVFAATSLTASFNDMKAAFQAAYPYITVTTSYGGSSTLATNINNGAPVDVFASADNANMAKITTAVAPVRFARNRLEMIVAPGNPLGIATLADLANSGVKYVTAAAGVPIRTYADQVLASASVSVTPVSLEPNVGAIVTKVTSGNADAGIVYRTDVIAAGSAATGVLIPDANNVIAEYPIAVPSSSSHQTEANLFINFVRSTAGQNIMISRGFIGA